MNVEETVKRANEIVKEKIFPTLREMNVGKRIQLVKDNPLLIETILFARKKLQEYADVEELDLKEIELIVYPEIIGPGQVVLNMQVLSKDDADLVRGELAKRDLEQFAAEKKGNDGQLPN